MFIYLYICIVKDCNMWIIKNKYIPFGEYTAMCLWPFIFTKKKLSKVTTNHEYIHGEQQKEMFIIFFLLWYGIEWFIKLCITGKSDRAYYSISFEIEAYSSARNFDYIKDRKHYSWIRYVFKLCKKK